MPSYVSCSFLDSTLTFRNDIMAFGYAVRPVGDVVSVQYCMDGQFGARLPDASRAAGYGS
jgi:hypothetical protein